MKITNMLIVSWGLAIVMSSCGKKTNESTSLNQERIPVKVQALEKGNNGEPISVSGLFTTDDEVILSFKTGGVINQIFVNEGENIKQGQILATLVLTEIDAQVQQATIAVDKATRDYNRALNLYKDSVATLEQVENSKTGLDLAKQHLSAARFNKGYSIIRAPKSGYVLKKIANVGQVVDAGTPVLQTNGAHSSNWILRVALNDADWSTVNTSDKAIVTVMTEHRAEFDGVVIRKSEGVDPSTGAFTADIKLTSNKPLAVATGMFGRAVIIPSKPSVATSFGWKVPYDAILDGDGTTGFVFVTNDNKIAHKVKVNIAAMGKNQVTITSGLETASQLIISGSAYLTDNSPIKIIQ